MLCTGYERRHDSESSRKSCTLVTSLAQTGQRIEEDPAAAARDVAPFYGVVPTVMERVLTTPCDRVTYHDLALRKEEFIDLGQSMIEMGLLSEHPDVDSLVDENYYQQAMGQK